MRQQYYHFYAIPKAGKLARRRNIAPVRTARESTTVRDYWNSMGMPTAVYISQSITSPEDLPFGTRLWT
jgi:hypothetical protein